MWSPRNTNGKEIDPLKGIPSDVHRLFDPLSAVVPLLEGLYYFSEKNIILYSQLEFSLILKQVVCSEVFIII